MCDINNLKIKCITLHIINISSCKILTNKLKLNFNPRENIYNQNLVTTKYSKNLNHYE